ncbi:hypothetical protein FSARC_14785 [Fusarium sarcochroum]|uniref:Uncharacterized protein n=1 Tax=Fusarium sarcochroum TaxID=1208366 RepID=A0A8H4SRB3_9HYPO|nr:hypothetical protein FSARC_14785 [Fusarium sarcochroum]
MGRFSNLKVVLQRSQLCIYSSTTLSESVTTSILVPTSTDSTAVSLETETTTGKTGKTGKTVIIDTSTTEAVTIETSTSTTAESTTTGPVFSCDATEVPSFVLPNPTVIFEEDVDDDVLFVDLPFQVGVYGSYSKRVYVSINGFVSLFESSSEWSHNSLPARNIPKVSILPYWTDLYMESQSGQKIVFQILETPSRGLTFTVEYIMSTYIETNRHYHFAVSFYKDIPGLVTFAYYQTPQKGVDATVGVQNDEKFKQYTSNTANYIPDQSFVEIDTREGSGSATSGQLSKNHC